MDGGEIEDFYGVLQKGFVRTDEEIASGPCGGRDAVDTGRPDIAQIGLGGRLDAQPVLNLDMIILD